MTSGEDPTPFIQPQSPERSTSIMTTSCPATTFKTSDWSVTKRKISEEDMRNRNEIYTNDSYLSAKIPSATTSGNSTSIFNFSSMTSLPPRPPRLVSNYLSNTTYVQYWFKNLQLSCPKS